MVRRTLLALLLLFGIACGSASRAPRERPPTQAAANDAVSARVDVGVTAPPIALDSSNGTGRVALAPGSVGLIVFWATWNGPSKRSFSALEALHRKYGARGLQIVAVSVDESNIGCVEWNGWGDKCLRQGDLVAEAARKWGGTFPVGWDAGLRIATQWAPSHTPTSYVVDRQRVIRHKHGGWNDASQEELERQILLML